MRNGYQIAHHALASVETPDTFSKREVKNGKPADKNVTMTSPVTISPQQCLATLFLQNIPAWRLRL